MYRLSKLGIGQGAVQMKFDINRRLFQAVEKNYQLDLATHIR